MATSRLGETRATETGGLVNLSKKFGSSLTEDVVPQPIDMLFALSGSDGDESESSQTSQSVSFTQTQSSSWDNVHDLASEIFFEIEESENNSESFT